MGAETDSCPTQVQKSADSKRKAESPRLVLELQTAKRAKIVTSRALQTLLVKRDNLPEHIHVNYSQKVNLDFFKDLGLPKKAKVKEESAVKLEHADGSGSAEETHVSEEGTPLQSVKSELVDITSSSRNPNFKKETSHLHLAQSEPVDINASNENTNFKKDTSHLQLVKLEPVNITSSNKNIHLKEETPHLQSVISEPLHKRDTKHETDMCNLEISQMLRTACPNFPSFKFKTISGKGLELKYSVIFPFQVAHYVFERLEQEVQYSSDKDSKIRLFGKWFDIPRKQVAFGETGLTYTFSGRTVKALEWTLLIKELLNIVNSVTGTAFNFVLINRYKDGRDHIGEHRDDEIDLDHTAPIASLSFGAARDFVLRHKDFRFKKAKMEPVTVKLESGSLLLMNPPTNHYWYHSLPVRKNCILPRVNLTFRKILRRS